MSRIYAYKNRTNIRYLNKKEKEIIDSSIDFINLKRTINKILKINNEKNYFKSLP